jgi:DNA-directed RNA polymerase specialized sigma subunit
MATLDAWEQYLIYCYIYEEMSSREIADLCGYAKSSVNEHLNSIFDRLRQEMS